MCLAVILLHLYWIQHNSMYQNKLENITQDWQFLCALQVEVKWDSIFLHSSGPSKSFVCPAPPKILWILAQASKKFNILHNCRQKGTYTRLHQPHVILNTVEKSSPRKGTKGIRCPLWNLRLPSNQKSDSSPYPESHRCNPHTLTHYC